MDINTTIGDIVSCIHLYNRKNGNLALSVKDGIIKTSATFQNQLKNSDSETIRECFRKYPCFMNLLTDMYVKEWYTTKDGISIGIVNLLVILIDKGLTKEEIHFTNRGFIQKIRGYLMETHYHYHNVNSVIDKIQNTNKKNYESCWKVYTFYEPDDEEVRQLLENKSHSCVSQMNGENAKRSQWGAIPQFVERPIEDVFRVKSDVIPGGHNAFTW